MKARIGTALSALLIAAVASVSGFAFHLRSQLNAGESERGGLRVGLEQCQEAVALGEDLYGEVNGAHAELILLYSIEHGNAAGNAREQYGKWQGAEQRLRPDQSERFFELSAVCLSY